MTGQSVALVFLLFFTLFSCTGEEKVEGKRGERVFEVRTVTAKFGEHYIKYRTSGFFEAVHSLVLKPEVSGRVVRLFVEEGDRVRRGEPLLKIEDSTYRKAYEEALANLRRARSELENQRAVYERRKTLYEKELISREEYEESKTRLSVLEAEVSSLKALLERKRIDLERTLLKSPIDGFVLRRLVEVGDYVSPQTGTYELVSSSPVRFVFRVPQEVARTLKVGKEVNVEGMKLKVSYISPSADENRLFTIKALYQNREGKVKPGSYGEVSFDYLKVRAVSVPEQALQLSERESFLWVVRNSRAVKVPVEVLSHQEGRVLVRGDLKKGDRIVVEGFMFLYEGAKVRER